MCANQWSHIWLILIFTNQGREFYWRCLDAYLRWIICGIWLQLKMPPPAKIRRISHTVKQIAVICIQIWLNIREIWCSMMFSILLMFNYRKNLVKKKSFNSNSHIRRTPQFFPKKVSYMRKYTVMIDIWVKWLNIPLTSTISTGICFSRIRKMLKLWKIP